MASSCANAEQSESSNARKHPTPSTATATT